MENSKETLIKALDPFASESEWCDAGIIINDITFLAFNYSNGIFIENLSNNIKSLYLEDYLRQN